MKRLILVPFALTQAFSAQAQTATTSFHRPDCSAFQSTSHLPERKCFQEKRLAIRDENHEALQKTGLEFVYLARPPVKLDDYPQARKALDDKAGGEFLIDFSVNTEGTVYDVKIVSASSESIGYIAKIWADTIAQWKFAKISRPIKDVPFRRLYLYSSEDEDKRDGKNKG